MVQKNSFDQSQDVGFPNSDMILVDTSVWINHFRKASPKLIALLENGEVGCHEFIIGELACGNLKNRQQILSLLQALPKTQTLELNEYLYFIETHDLIGKGIGFVDVHLLASAQLAGVPLWSTDKNLNANAKELHLAYLA